MSDFDLRKFLAEQKAPKEENIQEVEVNEEELDELRPGYAVGEMSPENNALLKALETLASKAGAAGKKVAAWAKDNIEVGKMSNAMKEEEMEEELDEVRPGYAVGEMSAENNALLKALETLANKAGAAGKKVAAWAKDNIEVGKMSDAMKEEEMEEGDMDESVVAGVAALIGGSLAAGKVLDYIADKYPEAIKKFMKATDGAVRGSGKSGTGDSYITQEGEEELKEGAFKASIEKILNS
jgi:hypothetical protein